jgi:class 3 adenylate cyclase/tetratricopeptide (TPR) repeat protein
MPPMTTCAGCGAVASDDARFCASCGRPLLVADDERRVVTVLFADLVGFTTLSERLDPEQVKNLVDRCFERLAVDVVSFGGLVDKVVGDALVALFGVPIAHEDDAERAVRAALRMHDTLCEEAEALGVDLQLRIGVNTGEVLVGAMRTAGSVTAMGDVVNTASRLQTAAEPGEVLVGLATHAATHQTIAYEARGLIAAKGRGEPVDTWRAVAPTLPPGYRARRDDVPLVGRDHELSLLRRAVDTSVRHERALLVLLVGDVGLGKTRLADEVASWTTEAHGAVVREGRCLPYGEANVWWPVAEALRSGLALPDGQTHEQARDLVRGQLASLMRRRATDAEVQRTAEGLLTLMGYDAPAGTEPSTVREEAGRALSTYANASSMRQPLVLQLSDLHWADHALLDLIDDVFATVHHRPVVMVATARPALLDRWNPRPGRHNSLVLHLDPLGREASAELLEALVGSPISGGVADALLDRSGGNPFFLEELVNVLDGDPSAESVVVAELPNTLRGLVAARIDDLSAPLRSVVQDASVIGPRGPMAGLREMSRQLGRTGDIDAAMSRLVADEIMEFDGSAWAFRSDLIREVAYQMVTKADRAESHLGIARYIEDNAGTHQPRPPWLVEQLAHHYGTAVALAAELGPSGRTAGFPADLTERALGWVLEAAERARRDQALPTAVRLYGQALDLLGPVDRASLDTDDPTQVAHAAETLRLHLARAKAAAEGWDLALARCDVDEACALADQIDDRAAIARTLVVRGDVEQKEGDTCRAIDTLTLAADRFAELDDDRGRGAALRHRGMVELFDDRIADSEASATAALAAYDRSGDTAGRAWASQNLAWTAFITGRPEAADRHLEVAIELFSEVVDTRGLAWSLGLLAWVRFQQGRVAEGGALAEQVLAEAEARSDPWATGMMLLLIASIRLWAGRTAEAVDLAERSLRHFESISDRYGTSAAGAVLGRALVMVGRVEEGFDLLARSQDSRAIGRLVRVAAAVQVGDRQHLQPYDDEELRALGDPQSAIASALVALQRGDVAAAAGLLDPLDPIDPLEAGAGPSLVAARALLGACRFDGRASGLASALAGDDNATYLDRAMAEVAAALEAAASPGGAPADGPSRVAGAAQHIAAASDLVADTGDRAARAVVALAAASVARRTRASDADDLAATAGQALTKLGIDGAGWTCLFDLALSPVAI